MGKIQISDINVDRLKKLNSQGTKSEIYTDGTLCYKFLSGLYLNEKKELYKKFLEMEGINLDNVIMPIDFIMKNGELQGYTMKYFKNSMPLSDKYLTRYFNCKDLFIDLNNASLILRNIHKNGIIYQDLSFENILVDDFGHIMFVDIDGCRFKDFKSPFVSLVLNRFLSEWRNSKISVEDIDNLSLILSLYLTIYGKELQNITKRQYHKLSDKIKTLENLREYANVLVDKKQIIYDLPYLDEIIDTSDDYIIDRNKQLSLAKRIVKSCCMASLKAPF